MSNETDQVDPLDHLVDSVARVSEAFASLTGEECDALSGSSREAFYAWRNGDADKVALILVSYPPTEPAAEPTAEPEVETPEKTSAEVQAEKRRAFEADRAAAQAAAGGAALPPPPAPPAVAPSVI